MATATAEKTDKSAEAKPRKSGGKNDARRLRKTGLIPAVLYGAGKDPLDDRSRSEADQPHPALRVGSQHDFRSWRRAAIPAR